MYNTAYIGGGLRSLGKEAALYRTLLKDNFALFFGADKANFPAMLIIDFNNTLNYGNSSFTFLN